jgi:hypothetical protein
MLLLPYSSLKPAPSYQQTSITGVASIKQITLLQGHFERKNEQSLRPPAQRTYVGTHNLFSTSPVWAKLPFNRTISIHAETQFIKDLTVCQRYYGAFWGLSTIFFYAQKASINIIDHSQNQPLGAKKIVSKI